MTERGGRWRAAGRFALFVALTDLAVALILPFVAAFFGPRTPAEMATGYAFLAVAALMLAALLWPVTLFLAAPVWFLARARLRRRGVPNRRGAALAALPCAAAFGLAPVLYLAAVPASPPEGAAAAAFLVTFAAALAAAPLSAWAVHRDD